MAERHHPELEDVDVADVMKALAEPVRLQILDMLQRRGETACTDVYAVLGLSKANASHHFRILRESGLIRATMHGRDLHTRIRVDELQARFPGLLDAVLRAYRAGAAGA